MLIEEAARSPLAAWESFYVVVGSSGAALTGLQFVGIAIIAESKRGSTLREISAFGTPTIVHFSAVLLNSAILSAPWRDISHASVAIAACGLLGIGYTLLVLRHARRQTAYVPVLEDWIWHTVVPFVAYGALFTSGSLLTGNPLSVLFVIGACVLMLLFVGIHNAWDSVTYLALQRRKRKDDAGA